LLVHGKLDILGTAADPVLLTSQGENWGGMVILNAEGESTWQHAQVEKMSGIERDGWILTGGITFYHSPVNMRNVTIGHNTSEDALNVIRATYSFNQISFIDTTSDAFDGDFTEGVVVDCSFQDIGGDAFDVSGSVATITNVQFTNIGDKAISAGENSTVTLENLEIETVNIGIASKDLSKVYADAIILREAHVAGLATYIKKPQYGPAFIEATNITFSNTATEALCQLESEIILNGETIPPEDVDVEALYEQGILGK
jgi:hypothetical protein